MNKTTLRYPKRASELFEYPQISRFDIVKKRFDFDFPATAEAMDTVLYVHIPFCLNDCIFCNYYKLHPSPTAEDAILKYFEALKRELIHYSKAIRRIVGIQFGGGTPACVDVDRYVDFISFVKSHFICSSPPLISMESDISHLIRRDLRERLHDAGIRRVSFGIQTFHSEARRLLRLQYPDGGRLVERIGEFVGDRLFDYNADLMYNLPDQGGEDFRRDVLTCLSLGINCVDLYHLNVFPGTRVEALLKQRGLYQKYHSTAHQQQFEQAYAALLDTQGVCFCTSNTVSAKQQSPNIFIQAQLNGEHLRQIGLGASARGFVNGMGYRNCCNISEYIEAVDRNGCGIFAAKICTDAMRRRLALMPNLLRCELSQIPDDTLEDKLRNLAEHGIIEYQYPQIVVSRDYYYFAGNISREFYTELDDRQAKDIVLDNLRNRRNMYNQDRENMK